MRVIYKTHRKINISGIDNHEVNGLDVVTAATLLNTSLGKVIGIFNEYAHLGKGSSIHSSGQLEWFKTHVDEKSIKVGGTQPITTLDGYSVPLLIKDGLAYATSLGRPTDDDIDRIPSTTPGADPPRDARDSGSARSHSTHLETSSSDRPKWSPTRSSTRYQDQISVTCTRWTLRMPSFTRATHAQPSLSNFTRRDSNFGERTRSRGTTLGERNFPTSPQNKKTKLTHCSIYVPMRTISTSHTK